MKIFWLSCLGHLDYLLPTNVKFFGFPIFSLTLGSQLIKRYLGTSKPKGLQITNIILHI